LEEYDQAKQAFTSFEMVKQAHWVYQHTPNGWVATKPPLVGWISAGIFALTRSWDLAWRLPSFLAALCLLFLVTQAARTYGQTAAFVAASAFSLNLFTTRLATLVRTDMPLALILFLVGEFIWRKIRTNEPWNRQDRIWIFLLLTAAMMIKGPIIYAFLLPGITVCAWRARRKGEGVTPWCGWWPWLLSLGVFAGWVVAGVLFVPEFYEHVVVREFAGRFSQAVHQSQPLYFYLPHLLHRFAPWSFLLVFLPLLTLGKERALIGIRKPVSPETFWLVAWSLGGVLVMSIVPSKRIDRIFPVVPPLCLLLAVQVADLRARASLRRLTDTSCKVAIVVACLFTSAYAAQRMFVAYRGQANAFEEFGHLVRQEAAARGLRYKVVGGEDEGMLLYLEQTEFIEPDQAVAEWKNGLINSLVVADDELWEVVPRLPDAVPARGGPSGRAGRYQKQYFFFVRQGVE
jgi:4-amino-4-deoxy-L-arabinose transferase-like glycosyltransferase